MSDQNPYAVENVAAISASADARAAFLQRTYSLLMAGVVCFAATLWAADSVPAVRAIAASMWGFGPLVLMLLMFGLGFGVRAVAQKHPINLIAYFAYTIFFGLLLAPLVIYALDASPNTLTQASIVTLLVFSGLTAYVFISGKDFSFMGGILSIGAIAMVGCIVAGVLFGFELGLWFSVGGVLLFSGFILYDTSRILRHYPTNAHVPAAIELFVSLIMLFQYVLHLLLSLNRD